ncbi:MAG: hypothetical protein R3C19_09350 [Planctomycetaceae bacterium]
MLDRELWLTPDQREPLRTLVDAAFPDVITIRQPPVRELELLVVPLFRIPDDKLSAVLTEPQQVVWKTLQDQFEREGNNVSLRTNDSHDVTLTLPDR